MTPVEPAGLATMPRQPKARSTSAIVRAAIRAELKKRYSHVLRDPIPDRMVELLKQLDQSPEGDQNTNDG